MLSLQLEVVIDVQKSPIGSLKPGSNAKGGGIKIKWTKDQLDKIADAAASLGASRDELRQLGIKVPIPDWKDALERRKLRKFLKEHLKVCREKRRSMGEKFQTGTEPWQMGDSFKEVDLTSSEVKSLGVEDLRLIPGVTLQKKTYEKTKGQDREILKGIKFFNIIDVCGSMFTGQHVGGIDKVHKALMMSEETWKICKKLGYDYNLSIFSDCATRIPKKKIKKFFADQNERAQYAGWNGGTTLAKALNLYSLKELKDGNLVIFSDMDIADLEQTKESLLKIGNVTKSFKVVVIEYARQLNKERIKQVRELFPDKKVEILQIVVK